MRMSDRPAWGQTKSGQKWLKVRRLVSAADIFMRANPDAKELPMFDELEKALEDYYDEVGRPYKEKANANEESA